MSKLRVSRAVSVEMQTRENLLEPSGFKPESVLDVSASASPNLVPHQISDAEAKNMFLNAEVIRLNLRIRELESSAEIDPVIDVFTRRAFMRELERARAMNARYDIPSAALVFHLSELKVLIDQYGPTLGDDLLLKIREVFRTSVRNCDTVARLSHDEFGIILFKTEFDVARTKAVSLSEQISRVSVKHGSAHIHVTAISGVAPCDSDQTPNQILARANRAKEEPVTRL